MELSMKQLPRWVDGWLAMALDLTQGNLRRFTEIVRVLENKLHS